MYVDDYDKAIADCNRRIAYLRGLGYSWREIGGFFDVPHTLVFRLYHGYTFYPRISTLNRILSVSHQLELPLDFTED